MDDQTKTTEQLFSDLQNLRGRVADMESIEEALFEKASLLDSSSAIIGTCDLDGRMMYANPAFLNHLGFDTLDEVVGRQFAEFWMVQERFEEIMKSLTGDAGPGRWAGELKVKRKDGSLFDVHASAAMVLDGSGNPAALMSTSIDITERKKAEEALKNSEEKWRSLVENAPDIITTVARNGEVLFINRTESDLGTEGVIGTSVYDYLHPEHHDTIRDSIERVFQNGEPVSYKARRLGLDGANEWYETRGGPVMRGGKVIEAILISTNITARKRAEEEREKLSAQLYQADKMTTVGLLAAGLAHEINNPIGFVLPNLVFLQEQIALMQEIVNLYERGAPKSEIAKFRKANKMYVVMKEIPQMLSDCLEGTQRVRDITRELRQFSSTDDAAAEKVDLSDLLDSSLTIAANEIKYRASVIKRYSDIPEVVVNRGKMSQVFLNLIVNAGQAIEEGHVKDNWIRVATGKQDDKVFVEFANSGPLIAPDVLPKIFDPFFSTKPQDQGTGLGLSISYSIVQQHGGVISVESTVEQGTVFRVWLPLDTQLDRRHVEAPASEAETFRPGRILIIDDEEGILRFLHMTLEPIHSVVSTTSGREALEILVRDPSFDLVLCDLMMPEISGMELFEKVQSEFPRLAEKFIFMTGGAFTPRSGEFVKRIDNLILEKPIELAALRTAVNELMAEK